MCIPVEGSNFAYECLKCSSGYIKFYDPNQQEFDYDPDFNGYDNATSPAQFTYPHHKSTCEKIKYCGKNIGGYERISVVIENYLVDQQDVNYSYECLAEGTNIDKYLDELTCAKATQTQFYQFLNYQDIRFFYHPFRYDYKDMDFTICHCTDRDQHWKGAEVGCINPN